METNDFFKDTFEYNYHFNQELIQLFEKEKQIIPEKSIKLLNHLINAQEIWNARILNQDISVDVWEIRPLENLKNHNETNYNQSLSILSSIELSKKIEYKNSKGIVFSNTVQDIIFHVINHSTYHRAQIASDLAANGIEPINTDYIFYKRK
ncbi:damage-inducible protein DinB [Flavobacterium sufflavum]|uniref:Damage-inducible protein DinB n=1 Tax=Flavobacterium sufflavum TaxID=1921138 RepID=A0A437KWE3_9FLAO|nr:DinB family protein [Flavobacterium sufflavum]RVT76696.1 damage-inducible protein DinB [Flavobacterium sufflavum]